MQWKTGAVEDRCSIRMAARTERVGGQSKRRGMWALFWAQGIRVAAGKPPLTQPASRPRVTVTLALQATQRVAPRPVVWLSAP